MREVFAANKGEIAGVILEPVVGNSGYIAPTQEFLQVRDLAHLAVWVNALLGQSSLEVMVYGRSGCGAGHCFRDRMDTGKPPLIIEFQPCLVLSQS